MNIVDHGSGRTVLFIHGWRLDGSVEAADIEPAFASVPGWRRLYPDLPGMGLSNPNPEIRDMDAYLDWLVELVDEYAPGESFAVAGTSAGASLARAVAHTLPDRTRGLMLRVPMLAPERRRQFSSDDERDAFYDREPADAWIPQSFIDEAATKREDLWKPARERSAAMGAAEPLRNDPIRYVLHGDFNEQLYVPALIIAGRQDNRVGHHDALSVLDQYPRATVAILDRASHVMPTGNRDLFDALIRDWLARMEEVWT